MGIANPRPAMRSREARVVALKLRFHANLMDELVAGGMDRAEASRVAMEEVRKRDFAKVDREMRAEREAKR